ncbi:hypothetical protein ACERII_25105 [Evansella sp. AB-rgal1]|uniref:hypothetical protein n=1 Tax=Evansella sp. AB-rgal1 TaxID=3242696 RepID=UPI00359CFEB4
MRSMLFQPPTDHYDLKVAPIDEKICELMKERKELADNKPGFPHNKFIQTWASKYGFYEEQLQAIFNTLYDEEMFKPRVEPNGFRKYIPVTFSTEKNGCFYTVPFIRQYENASVVELSMYWDQPDHTVIDDRIDSFFQLHIDDFECYNVGGGGASGHSTQSFIISPPLPDESNIELVFKEYSVPIRWGEPTGFEIVVKL